MKTTIKRKLKIYLPILVAIILIGVIIAVILLKNNITAKDYFDALSKTNYTKQVQHTTITDGETLIYEKTETIIFDADKGYHKIVEKQKSAQLGVDFDITTTEVYYHKDTMYYFDNNVWKSEEFSISEQLKTYFLKTDYFKTLSFDEQVKTQGKLQGTVKDEHITKIVSGTSLKDMSLEIVVNKNFEVQIFNISAKTPTTNRDVKIENTYTYQKEVVNLPV